MRRPAPTPTTRAPRQRSQGRTHFPPRLGHGHLPLRPLQQRQRPTVREEKHAPSSKAARADPRRRRQSLAPLASGRCVGRRNPAASELAAAAARRRRGPSYHALASAPRFQATRAGPRVRGRRDPCFEACGTCGRLPRPRPSGPHALPQSAQDALGFPGSVEGVQPPLQRRPLLVASLGSHLGQRLLQAGAGVGTDRVQPRERHLRCFRVAAVRSALRWQSSRVLLAGSTPTRHGWRRKMISSRAIVSARGRAWASRTVSTRPACCSA